MNSQFTIHHSQFSIPAAPHTILAYPPPFVKRHGVRFRQAFPTGCGEMHTSGYARSTIKLCVAGRAPPRLLPGAPV
jgi:hypothetical protein